MLGNQSIAMLSISVSVQCSSSSICLAIAMPERTPQLAMVSLDIASYALTLVILLCLVSHAKQSKLRRVMEARHAVRVSKETCYGQSYVSNWTG
jgi:hypothetical protein